MFTIQVIHKVVHCFDPATFSLLENLMATFDEMSAKITALSTTTATIKSEIDALVAAKDGGGMTADQEAQLDAQLDSLTTALADAAAAGAAPVPVPTPTPTPTPDPNVNPTPSP